MASLVRPNFTRSQVADLNIFEKHIQILFSQIPRDGSTFDLQSLFFKFTLDSATEFLFGESVHSLTSAEGSEQQNFGDAFDLAQVKLESRFSLGRMVKLVHDSKFDEACKVVHAFVDKIVNAALAKSDAKDAEKAVDGDGQPGRYIFLHEMIKSTRDPKQLRSELLSLLLAGRDTTASLLSNTFYILARRPDIWKKLKAEVDELHGEKPDYETIKQMKYTKYVLNESLRLYPSVPTNARFASRDTVLPLGGGPNGQSPIHIPKGAAVAWSTWTMHRRKDIYGDDAAEFRPERWEPDAGLRPGWGYLPFSGGPRICVGQQFALTEASYTIVRMLQEFGGIEDRDGSAWVEKFALTVCSAKGVLVGMTPR
ncbi:cytochrome P450 alkane hydroxylase protein [Rutstroemia sp. NJR-2017a BVV2]|nr:cytochrome P450 alkane hydroxylase protein [Rutstroemia sp. NJR-2017a BVV2]